MQQLDQRTRWALGVVFVVALAIAVGVILSRGPEASTSHATGHGAATVEPVEGSEFSRVRLSSRAVERLDVQTVPVRAAASAGRLPRTLIPYASVLYDVSGTAFAYTNPEPLVYVRAPITIESITGDVAVLRAGPPVGTEVVNVGAAELFGAEFGVDH
ncbi:MAG: hypothetical protein QOK29_5105 [Rhodospirillaceae bacterium]|jgi:hypothetical protein|nr:hypothetical protein [Miltoncostaeaceae bacterium]MEA2783549.1 hypothetical protein [Rhodospirillaceae bacterium]